MTAGLDLIFVVW